MVLTVFHFSVFDRFMIKLYRKTSLCLYGKAPILKAHLSLNTRAHQTIPDLLDLEAIYHLVPIYSQVDLYPLFALLQFMVIKVEPLNLQ